MDSASYRLSLIGSASRELLQMGFNDRSSLPMNSAGREFSLMVYSSHMLPLLSSAS
jgi:hypothetical protein